MHAQAAETLAAAENDWERRAFEKQLLGILPDMRAFARFLTRDPTDADDIVQEAVMRGLRSYKTFDLDTNIKAWMFCIIRNAHINSLRRTRPEPLDLVITDRLTVRANQDDNLELQEVLAALDTLSPDHREVITLVRAGGVTYEDAAAIMNCKIGTIKSRLSRADEALRAALGKDFRAPRKLPGQTRPKEIFA